MKNYIKILAVLMVFTLTLAYIPAISAKTIYEMDPDNIYKYEEIVLPKLFDVQETEVRLYRETFEYYSGENKTSTPDYVLIETCGGAETDDPEARVFGDYVIQTDGEYSPFLHKYGIYVPETQEVYDFVKAYYQMNIPGIDNVFTEAGIGTLIGDVNRDIKVNIKDATKIQKYLAKLEVFEYPDYIQSFVLYDDMKPRYISDFNRDGVRDIRDVTAIQKYLVGLEY